MRLVLATANPHKVDEIRSILAALDVDIDLVPRPDEVPDVVEDAPDLLGNARLKASALVEATGLPALADDTGLEVDALDGRPGVRSARYAGEDGNAAANVAKLLGELTERGAVAPRDRAARFRTVVVVLWPDGREVVAEGVVEGTIIDAPRGAGGFGYDPVFIADEGGGLSFAEMEPAAKDAISHRGRAVRALAAILART